VRIIFLILFYAAQSFAQTCEPADKECSKTESVGDSANCEKNCKAGHVQENAQAVSEVMQLFFKNLNRASEPHLKADLMTAPPQQMCHYFNDIKISDDELLAYGIYQDPENSRKIVDKPCK
jgi:hypothetical protein